MRFNARSGTWIILAGKLFWQSDHMEHIDTYGAGPLGSQWRYQNTIVTCCQWDTSLDKRDVTFCTSFSFWAVVCSWSNKSMEYCRGKKQVQMLGGGKPSSWLSLSDCPTDPPLVNFIDNQETIPSIGGADRRSGKDLFCHSLSISPHLYSFSNRP